MSVKESGRLAVLRQVLRGQPRQVQAAQKLGVSVRQMKRLCRRVRQQGELVHIVMAAPTTGLRGVSARAS